MIHSHLEREMPTFNILYSPMLDKYWMIGNLLHGIFAWYGLIFLFLADMSGTFRCCGILLLIIVVNSAYLSAAFLSARRLAVSETLKPACFTIDCWCQSQKTFLFVKFK